MKKGVYAFIVVTVAAGLLLMPCFQKAVSTATPAITATPKSGGVLKVIVPQGPIVFGYPPDITGISTMYIFGCIETLASMDLMGRYTPMLSTAYQVSPDRKALIFTLRKGVKFHDGTDWNAQAAKWNLDRAMAAKKSGTEYWSSVDVVDNYTVRINLTKFQNSIVTALVSTTGGMISPTAFERNGMEWAKFHPVGTGPFKFKSFERNVSVTWERFDDYWGGKPYLDGIKFVVIVDPMTQAAAFQAGEGDIIQSKNPSVSAALMASGKYDMIWGISGMSSWSPDSANPDSPYTNKKVREAVEYALDQKTIVDKLGQGMWKYTNQVAPQGSIGYIDSLAGRPYNPAKAKQLLAEAGYPSGFKTSLISNNSEVPRELLEAMQRYFADVGLTADIQYLPQAAWNELVFKGWHNGYIYEGVGMSPNYAYALNNFFGVTSPFLPSLRRSQGWGEALDNALAATDFEGMKRYTQEAVKIAHDDAMMIFTDAHGTPYFQHKYVQNSGFYAVGHFMAWTPEKCWLNK